MKDGGRAQTAAGLQPGQALGGADRHESRGRYEGLHGLVANPQPNPACAESCEQLDALYQKALPLAERLILEYRDTLQTGAPLDQAYQHTFGEN